jgi:hypothetical protein
MYDGLQSVLCTLTTAATPNPNMTTHLQALPMMILQYKIDDSYITEFLSFNYENDVRNIQRSTNAGLHTTSTQASSV